MSVTNTDPRKTDLIAKFKWPQVSNPGIDFSLPEPELEADVIAREKKSEEEIRRFIDERGIDIAAIIIEPIQGEGGDNHFRREFLQPLREICDENEMLLIFDEVQTGFGTTGRMWCSQHFGVMPDVVTIAKALANGLPIGAMLLTERVASGLQPGDHGTTFGGSPVPCAAGLLSRFKPCVALPFSLADSRAFVKLLVWSHLLTRCFPSPHTWVPLFPEHTWIRGRNERDGTSPAC